MGRRPGDFLMMILDIVSFPYRFGGKLYLVRLVCDLCLGGSRRLNVLDAGLRVRAASEDDSPLYLFETNMDDNSYIRLGMGVTN